jgi:hypothetical protein
MCRSAFPRPAHFSRPSAPPRIRRGGIGIDPGSARRGVERTPVCPLRPIRRPGHAPHPSIEGHGPVAPGAKPNATSRSTASGSFGLGADTPDSPKWAPILPIRHQMQMMLQLLGGRAPHVVRIGWQDDARRAAIGWAHTDMDRAAADCNCASSAIGWSSMGSARS